MFFDNKDPLNSGIISSDFYDPVERFSWNRFNNTVLLMNKQHFNIY